MPLSDVMFKIDQMQNARAELELRRQLVESELAQRAQAFQQGQRLREALTQAFAQGHAQGQASAPAPPVDRPTPDAPAPISQEFFGDPESTQAQQAAFAERYGPRNPGTAINLNAGLGASTAATLTTPPAHAEGSVQARLEPTVPGVRPRPPAPGGDTSTLQRTIIEQARALGLDPALALSLFETESNFDNTAVNPTSGAFSLAQFLPSTAKSRGLDVQRLKSDPAYAAQEGLRCFSELMQEEGSTAPALWRYGGAVSPSKRTAYTDKVFSKYAGNLQRVAGLAPASGGTAALAPAPPSTPPGDQEQLTQFAQQYDRSAMQMGPPEPFAPPPQASIPLPTTGQNTGDTETLRRVGLAHLEHGDPRVGAALLHAAKQTRDLQEVGGFLRQMLDNPGTSPEMRAQALASLGELLGRMGQLEPALKLLERALPMSERELLASVSAGTRDILLAQRQAGQPVSIRRALDEQEVQKGAQAVEIVTTEAGVFSVNKKTGIATPVTTGPQAPTGTATTPDTPGATTPSGTAPPPGKALPGKAMTEPQAKAFGLGSRALAAHTTINQLEAQGEYGQGLVTLLAGKLPELGGALGGIVGIVATRSPWMGAAGAGAGYGLGVALSDAITSRVRSEPEQRYAQAKADFIGSILRKESGAAISKDEYLKEDRRYFPQPGDTPATSAQKTQARAQALATFATEAGRPLRVPTPPTRVQTPQEQGIVTVPGNGEQVRIAS